MEVEGVYRMEKVLENGIYCARCNRIYTDKEVATLDCTKCDPNSNWEHIEIVMKGKGKWNERGN